MINIILGMIATIVIGVIFVAIWFVIGINIMERNEQNS